MTRRLPAVVLGIDTPIGLTLIRDLGRHGVTVYGLGHSVGALGMASRYLHQGLVRATGGEALAAQLVELGASLESACLFAISENDIEMLNRHRDKLTAYKIMFPDKARMDSVLNKDRTYAAAARVGIRTPRTEQVASLAESDALCAQLRFPVVLKWANPQGVVGQLAAAGLALEKTHYCDTPAQLLAHLRRFERVGIFPLIQEYCAGHGLGQSILMHEGRAHYTFQHQRIHEWPPEGGFSSMCESLPREHHQALMAQSIALLQALSWEGIAMVEYRHDPATGESALMEVNGRFWGSLPLACHAGAAFPRLCYQLLGNNEAIANTSYRSGIRCRYMVPETKRLLRILFGQQHIADKTVVFRRLPELLGYCIDFVRPASSYYVFELGDPRPFFSDLWQMFRKAVDAVIGRLRSR